MPALATCGCGQSFELKDEFAGRLMQCPSCGAEIRASGGGERPAWCEDPAFDRDKFLLRQKHLSISEKYLVWDEEGRAIMYVLRPVHFLRECLAVFGGIVWAVLIIFLGSGIIGSLERFGDTVISIFVLSGLVFAFIGGIAIKAMLTKKRHITFYRDESNQERLLEVKQDQKFIFLRGTYTLLDATGQALGRFEKNYIYNIFRKRWKFFSPEGALLYMAKEDSVILSLLRRLLGPFFGLLRTNYIILDPQERLVGQLNRKLTLLDRYVLDMTYDPARAVDRRVAVALGVMLDTGERR